MRKAVIIGSGGHAKVIIDILRENNDISITGCLSREGASSNPVNGVPIIGDDTELPRLYQFGVTSVFSRNR